MNAAPLPATRLVYVCGDCVSRLLAAGARRVIGGVIDLGRLCENHGPMPTQATSILEVPAGVLDPRPPASLSPPPTRQPAWSQWGGLALPPAPPLPAVALGPVTTIALDLLVAWTTEDKGVNADAITIGYAVNVARQLLEATGGQ